MYIKLMPGNLLRYSTREYDRAESLTRCELNRTTLMWMSMDRNKYTGKSAPYAGGSFRDFTIEQLLSLMKLANKPNYDFEVEPELYADAQDIRDALQKGILLYKINAV